MIFIVYFVKNILHFNHKICFQWNIFIILLSKLVDGKESIQRSDEELLQTARQGDTESFKELVIRYESRIAATVIGMLGRCPEAEDVGQETFIRFYNSMTKFRGDSSIGTYLTRIAINLSLNELKKRKRRSLFFSTSIDTIGEIPDNSTDSDYNEEKELIQLALQNLEPKFRAVLVLRLIDGYSTKETAKILKLPAGTVLSRLARAQEKLKQLISPYLGEKNEQKIT